MFDSIILLFILLNCVSIALEMPGLDPKSMERWMLNFSSDLFSAVFLVEMLVKVLALGLIIGKQSYFRSSWNIVDGFLAIPSAAHFIIILTSTADNHMLGILRVLHLIHTLRPLRVIKRAPRLKLAVDALMASVKPIKNILLICCAFLFFYGILGVQLFRGRFYCCVGEDVRNITNKTDCLSSNYLWVRRTYNFDNLLQVGNICLIFMLSSYIYAALGVELYGKLECSDDYPCLGLHAEANFRHFGVALITLYGLCTGDNWNMIMKDTLRECHPDEHGCMSYLSWVSPCTTNHQFRGYGPVCAGELGGRINHASAGGRQRGGRIA